MSERPRISVLRFRQLSTGRFYVPGHEVHEWSDLGKRRQSAACLVELTARALLVPDLGAIPGGAEVVEPANELLLVAREAEDVGEPARDDEVLAALERALGVPERGPNPGFARWPLLVHARGS